MLKNRKCSSIDVAREAGVSQATVSYVLNNVKGLKIKPETREAVIQAARKLNYHPDLIARGMRLKKSMSIGVVTDKDISNFMFVTVLEGIKDALVSRNYSITLCLNKSQDLENADHIKYYNSNRIDGIIFAFASLTDEHIAYLTDNNIPFAIIQVHLKSNLIHIVNTSMDNAISNAVQHLCGKGIKRIAYFGFGVGNEKDKRFSGYQKALERNGLEQDERILLKTSPNEEELEKLIDDYFTERSIRPGAVICESTNLAFIFLRYASKNGISIPDEMSVIAIGTSKFSAYSHPSLSAIEAPLYDIGVTGAGMLFDILEDNPVKDVVVLEWTYNKRESS